MDSSTEPHELLSPAEVAAILYVDPKTVTRWAAAGRIQSIRTPGGHHRFLKSEISALVPGVDSDGSRAPWHPAHPDSSAPRPSPQNVAGTDGSRADDRQTHAERVAAAAIVAEAVSIAADAEAEAVAEALLVAADAVVEAAYRAARAAEAAREGRALAATLAAEAVAANAAQTADAVLFQAEATAAKVTEAASRAAVLVAKTNTVGNEPQDLRTALRLAALVKADALATAEDTTSAAISVAKAVAAAAVEVAFKVATADLAIESEVARIAATVQAVAIVTAREVAAEADAHATSTALLEREAADSVRWLVAHH